MPSKIPTGPVSSAEVIVAISRSELPTCVPSAMASKHDWVSAAIVKHCATAASHSRESNTFRIYHSQRIATDVLTESATDLELVDGKCPANHILNTLDDSYDSCGSLDHLRFIFEFKFESIEIY